ncbi:hypothetical protein L7F22_036665 [Adiantum nelumboides]|nr:hypothetical protein [Adiantum nelumboides]
MVGKILVEFLFEHSELTLNKYVTHCFISTFSILWIHYAYPIFAQYSYKNPCAVTCANCHLAKKIVALEAPQSIFPNTVNKAIVKIFYDM